MVCLVVNHWLAEVFVMDRSQSLALCSLALIRRPAFACCHHADTYNCSPPAAKPFLLLLFLFFLFFPTRCRPVDRVPMNTSTKQLCSFLNRSFFRYRLIRTFASCKRVVVASITPLKLRHRSRDSNFDQTPGILQCYVAAPDKQVIQIFYCAFHIQANLAKVKYVFCCRQ